MMLLCYRLIASTELNLSLPQGLDPQEALFSSEFEFEDQKPSVSMVLDYCKLLILIYVDRVKPFKKIFIKI